MAAERIVKPNYKKLAEELAVKENVTLSVKAESSQKQNAPAAIPPPPPRRFVRRMIPRKGGFARRWR
jgi:hypothetical protein